MAAACRLYADCVGHSMGYLAVRSSPGDLMAQLDAKPQGDHVIWDLQLVDAAEQRRLAGA